MNRILFAGILAAFLAWQPGSSPLSQDKGSTTWKEVDGVKVLKLWLEPNLGPKEPQIAVLQLSGEKQKELQCDQLAFYKRYKIFDPQSEYSDGQFVIKLGQYKSTTNDPYIVVVVHDSRTYSASASFGVEEIK